MSIKLHLGASQPQFLVLLILNRFQDEDEEEEKEEQRYEGAGIDRDLVRHEFWF